jgi:hypothetical protein
MLAWNRNKVRQLTGLELWLFIVGRVLVALGVGVLLARYAPRLVVLGWPAVIVGAVALLMAVKGLARRAPDSPPES